MTEYKHNIPEERIAIPQIDYEDEILEQWTAKGGIINFYSWQNRAPPDESTVCIWRVKEYKLNRRPCN